MRLYAKQIFPLCYLHLNKDSEMSKVIMEKDISCKYQAEENLYRWWRKKMFHIFDREKVGQSSYTNSHRVFVSPERGVCQSWAGSKPHLCWGKKQLRNERSGVSQRCRGGRQRWDWRRRPPHGDGYPFCTPGGFCKPEKGRLWEFLGRREGSESTEKVNSGLRSQVGPRGL